MNWHNFRKRGQPLDVYPNFQTFFPGNFRSIWFSSRNFQNFRLNGYLFGYSQFPDFVELFPGNFPCHLSPIRKFRNFWSNGKRPINFNPCGLFEKMTSFSRIPNQDFQLEHGKLMQGGLKFSEIKVQTPRIVMFVIDWNLARYLGKTYCVWL